MVTMIWALINRPLGPYPLPLQHVESGRHQARLGRVMVGERTVEQFR